LRDDGHDLFQHLAVETLGLEDLADFFALSLGNPLDVRFLEAPRAIWPSGCIVNTTRNLAWLLIMRSYASAARSREESSFIGRMPMLGMAWTP
jgi:hypothetical protein